MAQIRIMTGHQLSPNNDVDRKNTERYEQVLEKYGLNTHGMTGSHAEIGEKLRVLFKAIEELQGEDTLKDWKLELSLLFPLQPLNLVSQSLFKVKNLNLDTSSLPSELRDRLQDLKYKNFRRVEDDSSEEVRLSKPFQKNNFYMRYEGVDNLFQNLGIGFLRDFNHEKQVWEDLAYIQFSANPHFLVKNNIFLYNLLKEAGLPLEDSKANNLKLQELPSPAHMYSNAYSIIGPAKECHIILGRLVAALEKAGGQDVLPPAYKAELLNLFKIEAAKETAAENTAIPVKANPKNDKGNSTPGCAVM